MIFLTNIITRQWPTGWDEADVQNPSEGNLFIRLKNGAAWWLISCSPESHTLSSTLSYAPGDS